MKVFITITKDEFDNFLNESVVEQGYSVEQTVEGNEIIYLIEVPNKRNMKIKLYSSIDRNIEKTREKGKDAIRILLFDFVSGKPIGKSKKIYRTEQRTSVFERIIAKIQELLDEAEDIPICKSCGAAMVKRYPGGNKNKPYFYGCLNWNYKNPKCNATMSNSGYFKSSTVSPDYMKDDVEIIEVDEVDESDEFEDNLEIEINEDFVDPVEFADEDCPEIKFVQVDDEGELVPVSELEYDFLWYNFEFLNRIQSVVFRRRKFDENLVLATMTGTGKTISAEMKMNQAILEGKKACYLSPLKAVTQERYDDWTKNHPFSDLNISIITGDYKLTEKRKLELKNADIILMTSEMLGARIRNYSSEKNSFLKEIGCLVVDEVHLIGMGEIGSRNNRGPKLEVGLIDFFRLNVDCKIVLLSATIPNCDELGDWCSILNGKDTTIIKSSWRPCELKINFVPCRVVSGRGSYRTNQYIMADSIAEIVSERQNCSLCFVHSKKTAGPILLNSLKSKEIDASYHNADLELSERLEIEREFKTKNSKTLVATATLAWGCNLPARDVHIMGIKRGLKNVHPYDIIQMAGRAGRPGFDERGDCFVYLPENTFQRDMDYCKNLPPLNSLLNDEDELIFHVVAEITNKVVKSPRDVESWFNSSFASVLGGFISSNTAEIIFEKLAKIKMIRKKMTSPYYYSTPLGLISTWMYLNPYDIYGWFTNFSYLNNNNIFDEDDDVSISWAIGNIKSFIQEGYISEQEQNEINYYTNLLRARGLRCYGVSAKACYSIYKLLRGEQAKSFISFQRGIKNDCERYISAIQLIDSMYSKWGLKDFFETLGIRLRYGCLPEQAELCKIPGVGSSIMKKLWNENIKTPRDVVNRPQRVLKALKTKTGRTVTAKKIISNARAYLGFDEE